MYRFYRIIHWPAAYMLLLCLFGLLVLVIPLFGILRPWAKASVMFPVSLASLSALVALGRISVYSARLIRGRYWAEKFRFAHPWHVLPNGIRETLFKISLEAYFLDSRTRSVIDEYLVHLQKEFRTESRQ